jgi:hypothetical protein
MGIDIVSAADGDFTVADGLRHMMALLWSSKDLMHRIKLAFDPDQQEPCEFYITSRDELHKFFRDLKPVLRSNQAKRDRCQVVRSVEWVEGGWGGGLEKMRQGWRGRD